jgi:hypothetical protein
MGGEEVVVHLYRIRYTIKEAKMKQDKQIVDIQRMVIDLSVELHHKVKTEALFRNITMKRYVIEAILERIKRDKKYQ